MVVKVLRMFVVAALLTGSHYVKAQPGFTLEYSGELQSDFRGGFNYPSLLRLGAEIPIGRTVSFEAASISIAKTSEDRLVDDLQTFSNIEEDNLPFAFAVLGLTLRPADGHSLSLGIRNVNEDYFTSPLTSLFTNSSCGIFPTLSCNYPMANYPLAFLGIHYAFEPGRWQLQTSIYDGGGFSQVVMLGQGRYAYGESSCYLGACFYSGDGHGQSAGTVWGYVEQTLTDRLSLIADCSHAFGTMVQCTDFVGLGGRYMVRGAEFGLFTDYALFWDNHEWATELTCKMSYGHIALQPAIHLIVQRGMKAAVALVRVTVSL